MSRTPMILSDPRMSSITASPRANAGANVLKTGTPADCPRVPEDAAAIHDRTLQWYPSLRPQNSFHCWLVGQVVVNSLRIEHNARIERRLRDRAAIRAERSWDDDRRIAAEALGEKLAKSPASTVTQLRQTTQGCAWLIARWTALLRAATLGTWTVDQTNRAFDLLGVRPEERSGVPGQTVDLDGQLVGTPLGEANLARRQVAELVDRQQEVADLDALDRALAVGDYVDAPGEELRRLRRHDAELHRRIKWCLNEIDSESPHARTNPHLHSHFDTLTAPADAPEAEAAPAPTLDDAPAQAARPAVEAERVPKSEVEGGNWPYLLAARREARERKAEAAQEARSQKRQQIRA